MNAKSADGFYQRALGLKPGGVPFVIEQPNTRVFNSILSRLYEIKSELSDDTVQISTRGKVIYLHKIKED